MPSDDRSKLLLAPAFGPMRALLQRLRAIPWPAPLQRATKRGLDSLAARIPELRALLGRSTGAPADQPTPTVQTSAPTTELPELLTSLGARDYQTRAKAAQGLASHADPQAHAALVKSLRDRSVEVAVSAATALSMAGGEPAQAALLEVLENRDGFYHPLTRAAAVHGLGVLLRTEQRAPLRRALRDLDAEVSIAAIAALSASGGEDGVEALVGVIENADGYFLPITRVAAARGLERLPALTRSELERLTSGEREPQVRTVLERLLASARDSVAIGA